MSAPIRPSNHAWLASVGFGTAYGVLARLIAQHTSGPVFGVMTFSFLFVVPLTIGFLAVRPFENASWVQRLVWPWAPSILAVVIAYAIGLEGAICIVMGLPIILVMASVGGVLAWLTRRSPAATAVLLAIPFVGMPIESRFPPAAATERTVRSSITIRAPAATIWREIASVRAIEPDEHRPALYTAIGFPRPVSATITRTGIGAVRHATFEGGVLFIETVTEWQPDHRLSFTIDAQTDSIPATTLDPHVTIGGEYFDILTGTYEIEPAADGTITLHLISTHRLSTRFDFYAGVWSDAIMRSIQKNILRIIAARAEQT
jgi:hypothetical protein